METGQTVSEHKKNRCAAQEELLFYLFYLTMVPCVPGGNTHLGYVADIVAMVLQTSCEVYLY